MTEFLKNLVIPRYQNNYFPRLLRKRFLTVVTIGILAFNIATGGGQLGAFAGDISSARLIELTNQERAAAGLNQLSSNAQLASAAEAKANNMFQLQYWAHYGPNGETPWQFILAAGYNYVYAGENLAKGFSSSEAVHSAWMASQTHRENIMKANYQDIGIAVVQGNLQGTDVVLVVQMFGALSQTPAVPTTPTTPTTPTAPDQAPPSSEQSGGDQNSGGEQGQQSNGEEPFVTITYPSPGDRIAEKTFSMTGTTNAGTDSVIIDDSGAEGEGTVGADGIWDYRPEGDWKDGEHAVTVWNEGRSTSSSIGFTVDTVPPVLKADTLSIESIADNGMVTLSISADETAQDVLFVAGKYSVSFEKNEAGVFVLSVSGDDIDEADLLKIVATDDLGNITEVDVTESIKGVTSAREANTTGIFAAGLENLKNTDVSRSVTRGTVVVIALLLFIDAIYLYRLNIIHTRGKTLFPMALWVVLMGIGLAVGRGGNIL